MARNGATRTGERGEVESVAVSLAELKPQLHRTRALHLQLRTASGSKRATKGDERAFKESRAWKKKSKWDEPSATPLDQSCSSLPAPSRRRGVNFRYEVNANISETPVGLRQLRNTAAEAGCRCFAASARRKTTLRDCSSAMWLYIACSSVSVFVSRRMVRTKLCAPSNVAG